MAEPRCDKCKFWSRGGIASRPISDANGNPKLERYWDEEATKDGACVIRSPQVTVDPGDVFRKEYARVIAKPFPRRHGADSCGEFSPKEPDHG